MKFGLPVFFFYFSLLLILFYSFDNSRSSEAQSPGWKMYKDLSNKLNFLYPQDWLINSRHDNVTGTTEIILLKPNSTRTLISILYNPNDALLTNSKTGKPIAVSKALSNLEQQISQDYIYFNATGKFLHKYTIQNYPSASEIVDYEKSVGKPGKMLIVLSKIGDKDSCTIVYTDSKRSFFKDLSSVSNIIKSIQASS
jgi:hypothetical protein